MTDRQILEQQNAAQAAVIERMEDALHTAHNALLIAKANSWAGNQMSQTEVKEYQEQTLDHALEVTLRAIQGQS